MDTNYAVGSLRSISPTKIAASLSVFSTCPSSTTAPDHYPRRVAEVARWSERAGCTGILIYTDNSLADPWMVSQIVLQNTRSLCPLVAVQPVYMHPYSVAKMVSTLGFLYGRRMFLNMLDVTPMILADDLPLNGRSGTFFFSRRRFKCR